MVKKPTYEELERMVKALERELVKQRQFAEELQQDCEHLRQLADQRTFELQKETTNPTQAEKALRRDKDNVYSLFETTRDMIWEVDQHSIYTYVSPQAKDLLGYMPEEMIGKSVFDFMPPDEAKKVKESNKNAVESQKRITMLEVATVHKEGHLVLLETNAVPIFGESGDYQGHRGIDRDITARKKMEEELRVFNKKFSAIFRSSPNAIAISTLEDRRILDANERFFQLSEYSREEAIGRTIYELNLWASEEESESFKSLLRKDGEVHNFEYTFNRRISGSGIGLLSASLFTHWGETYLIAILNDISERKRAEEAIRESEQFLGAIFDSIQDGISVLDKELRILSVNQAMQQWYGHMLPLEGKRCFEAYHMRTEACDVCPSLRALESGKLEMDEIPLTQAEGVTGTLELFAFPMLDDSGTPTGVVEYVRDITDRKQAEEALQKAHYELESRVVRRTAELTKSNEQLEKQIMERKQVEEALRESEKKYSNLFDATPVPTVVINKAGVIIDINNSHLEKIGGGRNKKEDYIGMNILMHPSVEKAGISELYRKTFEGEFIEVEQVYYPEVTRGSEGYFNIKAAPIFDKNGDLSSIIVTHEEVTERKYAEDALRESEEKYKTLFANAGDAILYMEVGPEYESWSIECNQRTLGLFGCEPDDIVGKRPAFFSPEIQPDGKSSMEEAIGLTRLVMEGQSQNFQWLHHRYDNKEPFWVEVNLTQLTLGGKSNYMQAVVRDITERKKAEGLVLDLSRQLISSQENERQMISYELHDSVAQDLSSSRITCEMLLKYKSLTPGARKQISEISGNLHKTLINVRDLSYNLRPPGLEKLGLTHVIYQFCEDFSEKTGVRVDFQTAGIDGLNLNYSTKINLYRLLQEGINNVKKHADADNVKVKLVSSFPNVILRIYDDGKGFDLKERLANASSEKKMGLSSMAHRVDLLLGRIDIESIPGKGTKILIEIPYKDEKS